MAGSAHGTTRLRPAGGEPAAFLLEFVDAFPAGVLAEEMMDEDPVCRGRGGMSF
jgi:hypothetical protein